MTFAAFLKKQTIKNELHDIAQQVIDILQLAFEAGEDHGFTNGKKAGLLEASDKKVPVKKNKEWSKNT